MRTVAEVAGPLPPPTSTSSPSTSTSTATSTPTGTSTSTAAGTSGTSTSTAAETSTATPSSTALSSSTSASILVVKSESLSLGINRISSTAMSIDIETLNLIDTDILKAIESIISYNFPDRKYELNQNEDILFVVVESLSSESFNNMNKSKNKINKMNKMERYKNDIKFIIIESKNASDIEKLLKMDINRYKSKNIINYILLVLIILLIIYILIKYGNKKWFLKIVLTIVNRGNIK